MSKSLDSEQNLFMPYQLQILGRFSCSLSVHAVLRLTLTTVVHVLRAQVYSVKSQSADLKYTLQYAVSYEHMKGYYMVGSITGLNIEMQLCMGQYIL
jgi:hypothetical protein